MTPDMVCTAPRADRNPAVDLSAIRRTDALIDLLASRRLLRPCVLGDPVITLLSSLICDVDGGIRTAAARPAAAGRSVAATGRAAAAPGGPATVAAGFAGRRSSRVAARQRAVARPPLRPGPAAPGGRYYGAHRRRRGAPWMRAVSEAVVVMAAALTAAGLMIVSLLARLTRQPPRS